jgi:hypothetical protein
MDTTRDKSEDVESMHREMEAPMDTQAIQAIGHEIGIPHSTMLCAHQRLIDDVRTRSGKPTGKVRCLECGTIFDDPYRNLD